MKWLIVGLLLSVACSSVSQKKQEKAQLIEPQIVKKDTTAQDTLHTKQPPQKIYPIDSVMVNVLALDTSFILDIKYATEDNFVKEQLYNCEVCYLIKPAAEALAGVQQKLSRQGYRIKLFDCYRPHSVQKRMWTKIPNPTYVADPAKGSYHNRGMAVDLTLVNEKGEELDMATPYDYFGREAHLSYTGLTAEQRENRETLQQAMKEAGFKTITSEWWHFSLRSKKTPLYNFELPCE